MKTTSRTNTTMVVDDQHVEIVELEDVMANWRFYTKLLSAERVSACNQQRPELLRSTLATGIIRGDAADNKHSLQQNPSKRLLLMRKKVPCACNLRSSCRSTFFSSNPPSNKTVRKNFLHQTPPQSGKEEGVTILAAV